MTNFEEAQAKGFIDSYPEWMDRAFQARDDRFPLHLMRTRELRFDELDRELGTTYPIGESRLYRNN